MVRAAFLNNPTLSEGDFDVLRGSVRGFHPPRQVVPDHFPNLRRTKKPTVIHNSTAPPKGARRFGLAFSLFLRQYWGNRNCFLFLCLLICLNSARSRT